MARVCQSSRLDNEEHMRNRARVEGLKGVAADLGLGINIVQESNGSSSQAVRIL